MKRGVLFLLADTLAFFMRAKSPDTHTGILPLSSCCYGCEMVDFAIIAYAYGGILPFV